ncbi:KTSC domain-containing protein [Parendozoicomonas sp. Alg238-R29]|uniref:KTSC domain-containing protein n=1 Tax=Parendozoicomonas sp. Alg238-R29 TaxID=2993446 RepID=UPI00248E9DCF|nr:KTSC domain-containing protein [Parendozoicomonas sp. Alg238-R29]
MASKTVASCESNVDNIESHYINGMFTDFSEYEANKMALQRFINTHLSGDGFHGNINGTYNESENALFQIFEVARQKFEDGDSNQAIIQFLNNDPGYLDSLTTEEQVREFLNDINDVYSGTLAEQDTKNAIADVAELLDTCSRVILVTHSQGNFYGNAVINSLYADYAFPNGYAMASYPMLGMMQIASPVNSPGGALGNLNPGVIGHLTNDNDLIMALVRGTLGSVPANYTSPDNPEDFTGHGLEASYLTLGGQSEEIATQMRRIAQQLTPYPVHAQKNASSSVMNGFGYSAINQLMDIEFVSGSVYRYSHVSPTAFNGLENAESQGGYFNTRIRDNYVFERLQ